MSSLIGPWRVEGCELIGAGRLLATLHWHSGLGAEDAEVARAIEALPDLLAACEIALDETDREERSATWQVLFNAVQKATANRTLPASENKMREALAELWQWVEGWSPFDIDPEWPATRDKVLAALSSPPAKPAPADLREAGDFYADLYARSCGLIGILRTALKPFANIKADDGDNFGSYPDEVVIRIEATAGDIKNARSAMEDTVLLRSALSASPEKPTLADGWQPIETCELWQAAIVTDGDNVAIAQKAEADYGGHYWAVDPEDDLEWEPTHWILLPALSTAQGEA